jgi:hypothetical protein
LELEGGNIQTSSTYEQTNGKMLFGRMDHTNILHISTVKWNNIITLFFGMNTMHLSAAETFKYTTTTKIKKKILIHSDGSNTSVDVKQPIKLIVHNKLRIMYRKQVFKNV